jgi:hypothetical protein
VPASARFSNDMIGLSVNLDCFLYKTSSNEKILILSPSPKEGDYPCA